MELKYNSSQRREYLVMTDKIGHNWMQVFQGNPEFYSAAYWDLFTGIWRKDKPVRKTDALKFMQAIKSAQTAGKYLDTAIAQGFLREEDNPKDARSKLVALSADMRQRLDRFFDLAVQELCKASKSVLSKGPCPDEP